MSYPVFPFELIYKPHTDVKYVFPEIVVNNNPLDYVERLTTINENANLFEVYALDKPVELGGKEIKIGTLKLKGKLVNSSWADKDLFFRHQKMDEDL